jgi:hypothetical protein
LPALIWIAALWLATPAGAGLAPLGCRLDRGINPAEAPLEVLDHVSGDLDPGALSAIES